MSQPISLTALEDFIASRSVRLTPDLQQAFEDDRKSFLSKAARDIVLHSIIAYNLYFLLDICLLPNTCAIAAPSASMPLRSQVSAAVGVSCRNAFHNRRTP